MPEPEPDVTRPLTRRGMLAGSAGVIAGLTLPRVPGAAAQRPPGLPDGSLFTLGVASGDPLPDGIVLWTRLAPDPVNGGGMPERPVRVQWEVAEDERFRRRVRRGVAIAHPDYGHAVHAEVEGLAPARWYFYRFRVGTEESPVGLTRTAPAPGTSPRRLRFAFASCQSYQPGFFAAYRHMAEEDLDLVVHLGDYIYEGAGSAAGVRRHEGTTEPGTLAEYRNRHAQYKLDPDLQAAHAACPFMVTWDDHEVDNDWAAANPQDPLLQSPEAFARRRANAFQAYWEHMPLRRSSVPRDTSLRLYRHFTFGDLVEVNMLDGRQYRTDQPCFTSFPGSPDCPERTNPANSMLGAEQEAWLVGGLQRSRARWNVLANQTIFAPYDYDPGAGQSFNMDQWDGYPAQRQRLLELFASGRVANPVVITGDWHSSWVNELRADAEDPESALVGTELVGTSISSACGWARDVERALGVNPDVRFFDGDRRGYVRCELTRERWEADFRLLPPSDVAGVTVPARDLPLERTVSFVLEHGRPGLAG